MNISIENKTITKTAVSIGVSINFVSDNTANCRWSLNDDAGNSVDAGTDTFEGLTVSDILQKLFIKLNIQQNNETTN